MLKSLETIIQERVQSFAVFLVRVTVRFKMFCNISCNALISSMFANFDYKSPITVEADALLNEAHELFKQSHVDTLIVIDQGQPIGVLDIQDLNENA